MFCENCGTQLPDDAKFCASCGTTLEASAPAAPPPPAQAVPPAAPPPVNPPPPVAPPPPVYAPPPPVYAAPPAYQPGFQPYAANTAPLSMWQYIGMFIVMAIPIVNLILIFSWAFGGNANVNKRNYARAVLFMALIGIVISVVLTVLMYSFIQTNLGNIQDFFSNWSTQFN